MHRHKTQKIIIKRKNGQYTVKGNGDGLGDVNDRLIIGKELAEQQKTA